MPHTTPEAELLPSTATHITHPGCQPVVNESESRHGLSDQRRAELAALEAAAGTEGEALDTQRPANSHRKSL